MVIMRIRENVAEALKEDEVAAENKAKDLRILEKSPRKSPF